jgi:hypothetical protein
MLNLVPLAGGWWIMRNRDAKGTHGNNLTSEKRYDIL